MSDEPMRVWDWSTGEEGPDRKLVLELEGKTKDLVRTIEVACNNPEACEEGEAEHLSRLPFIPEFHGTWMRVRITVEVIDPKHDE